MGGDAAPSIVVEGAFLACQKHADVSFLLFGDEARLSPLISKYSHLADRLRLVHTDEVITNDTKVMTALRTLRQSSMRLAIEAVKDGQAAAVVSAGNTGAYMALSKVILKTIEGIERPAIATMLPTVTGKPCVALDLGANAECSADNLLQFALMGDVFARSAFGIETPKVGLLNIGSEELKGNDVVQLAAQKIRACADLNFYGFVEGDDFTSGRVDVVVTDGFSGNIALKAMEGTARFMTHVMRESISSNLMGKLAYLIGRSAFQKMRDRLDPRLYNGAAFLGLRGLAIKSHGGTDGVGFANAISVAIRTLSGAQTTAEIEKRLKESA